MSFDNLDPRNVGSIPDMIFNDDSQPVTSTPKPSRKKDEANCIMSADENTSIDKQSTKAAANVASISQENCGAEQTPKKSDDSTVLDETNKPPNKEKKIPHIRFEEILKGNWNVSVVLL